jgi:hypothetical protein
MLITQPQQLPSSSAPTHSTPASIPNKVSHIHHFPRQQHRAVAAATQRTSSPSSHAIVADCRKHWRAVGRQARPNITAHGTPHFQARTGIPQRYHPGKARDKPHSSHRQTSLLASYQRAATPCSHRKPNSQRLPGPTDLPASQSISLVANHVSSALFHAFQFSPLHLAALPPSLSHIRSFPSPDPSSLITSLPPPSLPSCLAPSQAKSSAASTAAGFERGWLEVGLPSSMGREISRVEEGVPQTL